MTKETMIWQILSIAVAKMVKDKNVPEDKELFQKKCIESVKSIMADVSDEEILIVMNNYDITGFAEKMSSLNAP